MKIDFIGGGNMAAALIGGLIKQGFAPADIGVVEPFAETREKLARDFSLTPRAAADATLGRAEIIVVAVKPQNMREAAAALQPHLSRQLVLSVAAGIRLVDLGRWLGGHARLMRAMPNTPSLIGRGIAGLFAAPAVDAAGRAAGERILGAVGKTVWVAREELLDPVTAVSASGPAYVFYFLEAMQEAGERLGLDADTVKRLSLETFLGAAALAAESPDDFATLRAKVTSKGGTTAAALGVMGDRQVKEAIVAALVAASARGTEMGVELGRD